MMKKYVSLLVIALMFCAVISIGCGGGSSNNNSADTEQTESLTEDTGSEVTGEETGENDPNEEGRGGSSDSMRVIIKNYSGYTLKSVAFYGRFSGGNWHRFYSDTSVYAPSKISFSMSKSWACNAFGFEFDQKDGTDWPFSGPFWYTNDTSSSAKPDEIEITLTGILRMANITIKVDGREVFSDTNCDSHSQYNW